MSVRNGTSKIEGTEIVELFLIILGMGAFFYFIPLQAEGTQTLNKAAVSKSCPVRKSKPTGEKACAGTQKVNLDSWFADTVSSLATDLPEAVSHDQGD